METLQANPYKYNHAEYLYKSTLAERNRMIESGMEQITEQDFLSMLSEIGFKLDNSNCFYYSNTSNEISYNARALYIIDIKTKLSFAHVNFGNTMEESERREKLQKIRRWNFVFEQKRDKNIIWEL
jgi:hypothetical protein